MAHQRRATSRRCCRRRDLAGYGANSPCSAPSRNATHSLRVNRSCGPSVSFESRTVMTSSTNSTSTHCPESPYLLLLRHIVVVDPFIVAVLLSKAGSVQTFADVGGFWPVTGARPRHRAC